jgi:hypothetical protein
MADDIVTRLRKAHDEAKHWIEGGRWSCPKTIHSEAADEIERLRKDRKELLEIAQLFADYGQCQVADEFWNCVHVDGACEWHGAEHLWESFCMSRGI